jgi:hypothetical protein
MESEPVITTAEFIDVRSRVRELGCTLDPILTFLPINLEDAVTADDFVVRGEVTTIHKVLALGGISTAMLGAEHAKPPGYVHNKSHDWAVPIIFVAAEMFKTSPDLVGAAIDLIRDYAVSLFKGSGRDKHVKIEVVVEREKTRTYQKITYEGDVSGIGSIAEMIAKAHGSE